MPVFSKLPAHSAFFNRLHRSNLPLPPRDEEVVRTALSEAEREISSINLEIIDRITNGNRAVHDLVESSRQLEEEVLAYTSMLSAVRRLPVDVLSKIIAMHALTIEGSAGGEIRVVNLATTLVSKGWRAAALRTPSIWTCINVDCEDLTSSPEDRNTQLHTLLQRSDDLHLSVSIRVGHSTRSGRLTPAEITILKGLIAAAPRWMGLSLECRSTEAFAMLNGIQNRVPNLKQVDLHTRFNSSEVVPDMNGFSNAPNLLHMRVDSSSRPFILKLPLHQLVTYTEHGFHFYPKRGPVLFLFNELIPQFTNITILELPDVDSQRASMKYSLSRLLSLVCKNTRVLNHIVAPALNRLEVLNTDDLSPLHEFYPWNGRCTLQVLVLHNVEGDASRTLPEHLRRIPSLTDLYIQLLEDDQRFLQAFRDGSPSGPMLPNLKAFTWVRKMSAADASNAHALKRAGKSHLYYRRDAVPCTTKLLYTWGEDEHKLLPEIFWTMLTKGLKSVAIIPDGNSPLLLTRPRKYARYEYTPEEPMILRL